MGKFTTHHEEQLRWYYTESRGALGLSSSLGPMINMAMSGIQQGGKTNAEHTNASMDSGSVVERQRIIAEAIGSLSAPHQATLNAHYGEPLGDRRKVVRKGDSPKEAGEYAAIMTPAERLFDDLAGVATMLRVDAAGLLRDRHATFKAPPKMPKAEALEAARVVAGRVADAKKAIERAKRDAQKALDEAREAFAVAWKAMPPRKARRSLRQYQAWLDGGAA